MNHRTRLARARQHLDTLDKAVDAFLKSQPYEARTEYQPEADCYNARFFVKREIPAEWSLIVGDVVHNIRSSLDNLAYALVVANSGKPSDTDVAKVFFVLCDVQADFADRCKRNLWLMSASAQAAIERLQPYHRADPRYRHPLSAVRDLSNIDKHRHLILTFATATNSSIGLQSEGLPAGTVVGGYVGPLVDGTVFGRWRFGDRPPDTKVNMRANLTVAISFAQGPPTFGAGVREVLKEACDHIENVVFPALEPFL